MKKGFTLVEIMIVVAIIAILAAVAIPNFIGYRQTSQEKACEANQKTLENAAEAYLIKNPNQEPGEIKQSALVSAGLLKEIKKCPIAKEEYKIEFVDSGTGAENDKITVTCTHGSTGSGS